MPRNVRTLAAGAHVDAGRTGALAGIGLLVAGRLSNDQRRAVGRTLLAIGAFTTIPLALQVLRKKKERRPSPVAMP